MTRYVVLNILTAVFVSSISLGAHAEDRSSAVQVHEKKMKMNEPMTTGMMKKGMMKGDVRSAADKKAKDMQPTMEQEEKSMLQDKAKR